MIQEKIDRINILARKAKTAEGLRAAFSEDTYKDLVERFAVESEDNEENETEGEESTVYAPILEWLLPAA
jgi:hypothetical protein